VLKAFLSHRFDEHGRVMAGHIACLLKALEVDPVDGHELTPGHPLPSQIEVRISTADLLVLILSSEPDSVWIHGEAGYARGRDIPVVVISDSTERRGLFSSDYFVDLRSGEFAAAASLTRAITEIKKRKNVRVESPPTYHSSPSVIDAEGWSSEVREDLSTIRKLIENLDFGGAMQVAARVLSAEPRCWRAAVAMSACLMNIGGTDDLDKAEELLRRLEVEFQGNARALSMVNHNRASILVMRLPNDPAERNEALSDAVRFLRKAIELEPRLNTYVDLVLRTLECNKIKEAEEAFAECLGRFSDKLGDFCKAVEAEGPEFVNEISKSTLIASALFPKTRGGSHHD
jgi:hypothetical protein